MPNKKQPNSLLIADEPGHILERLCLNWEKYGSGVHHEVRTSLDTSNYHLCQLGKQYDVIHWLDQLRFIHCASAVSVPQVVMVHHLTSDMQEKLMSKVQYCDAITTSSNYWFERLVKIVDVPVFLLPYTIDTNVFFQQSSDAKRDMRYKAGIEDNEFVLGYVGKAKADHMGRKGLDLLIEVLQVAAQKWSNLAVVLVGPGWESLMTKIQGFGIHVLHFEYSTSEETCAAYWLMDTLLLTSKVEGGPVTALEAMACGVPVITSQVGHIPEVIQDGKTGFICKERQPLEYINAIDRLYKDNLFLVQITENARAFVVRERENSIIIPRLDFSSIYFAAQKHHEEHNTNVEKVLCSLSQSELWMRHQTRRFVTCLQEKV